MKILFITQFLPFPPDTGGKIKTLGVLNLLKKHQLFLVSFVDQEGDLSQEANLKKICRLGVKTFVTPIITTKHRGLTKKAILGFLRPTPFRVQKYFVPRVAHFLEKITKEINFDAIYCDHLTSSQYLRFVKNQDDKIKVLDEHNISSELMISQTRLEKNPIIKIGYLGEAIKFWLYERKEIKKFDLLFAISRSDQQKLKKKSKKEAKVLYLPTPFEARPLFKFGPKTILFVGLLSWRPNEEAVLWFAQEIFAKVRSQIPGVEFLIIGANASAKVKRLGNNRQVKVLGYVKDVKEHYKNTGVFVAPVKSGGGIRIKILDALAHGLPVVATPMAISGIKLRHNQEVLIANKPEEFSQAIIKVLKNKQQSISLSQRGMEFIAKNNSHERVEKILQGALR